MNFVTFAAFAILFSSTSPRTGYQPETCSHPVCSHEPLCPNGDVCAPIPHKWLYTCEKIVDYIFFLEYSGRFLTVWTVSTK